MKKYFYFVLALVVGVVFASCSKDNDDPTPNPEVGSVFLFSASISLDSSVDSTHAVTMMETAEKALLSVGFSADNYTMELSGPDSAAVSQILMDKMAQVEEAVKANLKSGIIIVGVKGAEKKNYTEDNNKNRSVSQWYHKRLGSSHANGSDYRYGFLQGKTTSSGKKYHGYRFVKSIATTEHYFSQSLMKDLDYETYIMKDLNDGAGGDYIYLWLKHSGKANTPFESSSNHFVWEGKYITDVIAIYGGGEPKTIRIDGRNYTKASGVGDLNKKAGGEYIWLYTTTDPVAGYQGYYLNTGCDITTEHHMRCRVVWSDEGDFDATKDLGSPKVYEGHRFVERAVKAYKTNGSSAGLLDTNYSRGDGDRIHLILVYATKEGGY